MYLCRRSLLNVGFNNQWKDIQTIQTPPVLLIFSSEMTAPDRASSETGECDIRMYTTQRWRHAKYTRDQALAVEFLRRNTAPVQKSESSCRTNNPNCCWPDCILPFNKDLSFVLDNCHVPCSRSSLDEVLGKSAGPCSSNSFDTACSDKSEDSDTYQDMVRMRFWDCGWVLITSILRSSIAFSEESVSTWLVYTCHQSPKLIAKM